MEDKELYTKRSRCFIIGDTMNAEIDQYSTLHGISRSQFVRCAIHFYIKAIETTLTNLEVYRTRLAGEFLVNTITRKKRNIMVDNILYAMMLRKSRDIQLGLSAFVRCAIQHYIDYLKQGDNDRKGAGK